MKKNTILLTTLLTVYMVSAAATLTNPAHLNPAQVSLSMQAATLAALGIAIPLVSPHHRALAQALLAVGGASLALRLAAALTGVKAFRWDLFAMYGGLLSATGLLSFEVGGLAFSVFSILLALPVILALPRLPRISTTRLTYAQLLDTSLEMSQQAYRVSGINGADYINDTRTGTLAGVGVAGGDTYVFFSGTTSSTDWLRVNANFEMKEMPASWTSDRNLSKPPKIHSGFLTAYSSIRDKVWAKVQENVLRIGGSGRIICCGHSLGGALATVAALDLACRLEIEDVPKLGCVTFGAPQVFSTVDAFDAMVPLSLRVAAVYDPVPRLLNGQLPHVKGLVTVASVNTLNPHSLESYKQALKSSPGRTALMMMLPMLVVTLLFMVIRWAAQTSFR